MEKKNQSKVDKKGSILTEIEDLTELVEREKASVSILLMAASGDSQIENDDVVMTMRDSSNRIDKMEESLERIEQLVL